MVGTLFGPGRLIPACAGKTTQALEHTHVCQAHPRVCGENGRVVSRDNETAGSSPRVRGKPSPRLASRSRQRLIPACAGKTDLEFLSVYEIRAHPRVCGENGFGAFLPLAASGSSPRVRGKLFHDEGKRRRLGLIPACAGKTASLNSSALIWPAHPRVCGENAWWFHA